MPSGVRAVFQVLPTDPVVEVARLAYAPGTLAGDLEAALWPPVRLLAWAALAIFVIVRWFRWEPRRS
ncbi:hypothetical protein [Spongiactinospora sp. TRM90649]|uniref:hypothetical protein n=1 Tax=Spongiactinospora sp. TRM90649 TaxID=3031114 RepID=UPI0023F98C7D|nr:hypothetical protein [Spongiactinospora sp. TRM90649]MDF5755660.1 hypothetical protein [Spongiactinospora sp. TRM90649]